MIEQDHISDQDLKLVIAEQATGATQKEIEAHIATCEKCQSRLLGFAADESWRKGFCSSIIAIQEQAAFEHTDTRSFSSEREPECSEYDLQTVDHMLERVLQPATHPETLGRLGRYEVEKVIGFGGMGIVLRGFDRELHRPVAIKMISPRLANNGTSKQRFLREAKAAGAILHPNVIGIHDISDTDDVPWFVMPLVVGPTLQEVIDNRGPLPAKEVVRIGKQIAAGLAAAHRQGLVHRDIKPANILVDNQINRIVITDFGLARREAEESMTQTGMVAGTLNYMSPEQSRGEDVDARSDLFSLGSVLFFLSTGITPFHSSTTMGVIHKVGTEKHADAQSLNPDVPRQLARMFDRLLEKDPADRFQTASEVEEWLSEYLAHMNRPAQTQVPNLPAKPEHSRKNTSLIRFVAAAVVTIAVTASIFYAGTWFATQPEPQPITWTDIKSRYGIESSDQFEQDLGELNQDIEQLIQFEMEAFEPQAMSSSEFNSSLQQLDRSINLFSEQLNSE